MNEVLTPDGWGQVLRTESAHGKTSYLVKGAGFEGWYDGLQVQADFADQPDDVVPNEDNETTLPYPSRKQGPGWDGTTSTIEPGIDPHLEMGHASDSLTGDPTDDDPVDADIEGLFEPHSRLSSVRRHRVHFAQSDDIPILNVHTIPEDSPVGLDNSPINPDGVSTDDLFNGESFEARTSSYDRLVIEDDLSFMHYAADDDDSDDKKKDHHEQDNSGGNPFAKDDDDDDSDDDDDDDDDGGDDDSSSDGDSDDGGSDGGDGGGDGGGGHTASVAYALTTTADLHFLANMCSCDESIPLHSKSEHREIQAEGSRKHADGNTNGVDAQPFDADKLYERYEQGNFNWQESNLRNLVDNPGDDADDADLYNKYASTKTAEEGGETEFIKHRDGKWVLLQNGDNPRTGKKDGEVIASSDSRADIVNHLQAIEVHKHGGEGGVHAPYRIEKRNGRYHVVNEKGESKEKDGYGTREEARQHQQALYANVPGAAAMAKKAAPAQPPQPTQIESQIEQLMQFWAVDNNGWWHWTGSQSDLALLNQMQQQMMAVGMPQGQPGAMQAQSKTAAPAAALLAPELLGGAEAAGAAEGAGAAAEGEGAAAGAPKPPGLPGGGGGGGGGMNPAGMISGVADAIRGAFGGKGTSRPSPVVDWQSGSPQRVAGFVLEANTPPAWTEYLNTIASDKLVALAAWADVVQKSKRLRSEGAIDVEVFKPEVITAYVQGDNGRYYTTVQRLGSVEGAGRRLTSTQVSGWSCECEWGHWAWLRKRSFVGRMCSHAYALFSEMRSLDAKARKTKGQPGRFASVNNKAAWARSGDGFEWVTNDPTMPTAAINKTASGWNAQVWSDGTAEDSLDLGTFKHSEYARRAVAQVILGHIKISDASVTENLQVARKDVLTSLGADDGDVDLVSGGGTGSFSPGEQTSEDPYAADGEPKPAPLLDEYDDDGGPGIQNSKEGSALFAFAEASTGDDDEGPEEEDSGIEEEDPEDDDESLDEEIAEDEADSHDGDDEGGEEPEESDDMPSDDDGGHDEPHKRDDGDDDDEGTDNPGDDSDDDHVEKHSSVAELQAKFGLSHLAGADYSPSEKAALEGESKGKLARNHGDLNLAGTHYEASAPGEQSPEDTLAFLF